MMVLFTAFFLYAGCDDSDDDENSGNEIEIAGTWFDAYDNKIVITDDAILWYYPTDATETSYEASIAEFDNDAFNAEETGENDHGHAVIRYTKAPSWNTASQDKYMVFRWQNFDDSASPMTMDFVEGSDYPANTYFDTADLASEGATAAAGFFSMYTTDAELQ